MINHKKYELQTGDIIVMGIDGLPIEHWAMVFGDEVIENRIFDEVKFVSISDFFNRYDWWKLKKIDSNYRNSPYIPLFLNNARNLVGEKYDLLNFNCQHLINKLLNKPVKSPSLEQSSWMLGFIVLSGFIGYRIGKQN